MIISWMGGGEVGNRWVGKGCVYADFEMGGGMGDGGFVMSMHVGGITIDVRYQLPERKERKNERQGEK